jgi:hypothetical protein
MTESPTNERESEGRATQLLDHLFDQWLTLGDALDSAEPDTVLVALNELDDRLNTFTEDIDPDGHDQGWYDLGRNVFRQELNRRIQDCLISIENRPG